MLAPLIRKAVVDAGFDLTIGSDGEWQRIAVSGLDKQVWIVPVHRGALIALPDEPLLREFVAAGWTDVPLPQGAAGAVRCQTAAELYDVLRRVRVLIAQLPPAPEQRMAERLASVSSTEAHAIVKQRIGQDVFRQALLDYWDGRCAVTGLAVPELLRASHAKPWKDASDFERLHVYNGFLLAVHLDALFDSGYMTFETDGRARFSNALPEQARLALLGDRDELRLSRIATSHLPYLAYHTQHVFRGASQ